MSFRTKLAVLALASLAIAGCDAAATKTETTDPVESPEVHDHGSLAQRGGALVELGDHVALLEVVHDEASGVVDVYVMDMNGNAVGADGTPVLNTMVEDVPEQIEGVGAAGEWKFTADALKGHVEGARIRIGVNGKTFTADLPHTH